MTEDDLRDWLDSAMRDLGCVFEPGNEQQSPPLEVLGYYVRRVRITWVPIVGQGLSIVAVCRMPSDLTGTERIYRDLIERLSELVNSRFPPIFKSRGITLGLSVIVLTNQMISADEDSRLARVLEPVLRTRVVPLSIFVVNLEQDTFASSLKRGPEGLFPESESIADGFASKFRRFLPLINLE